MRMLNAIRAIALLALSTNTAHSVEIRVSINGAPALTADVPNAWVIGEAREGTINVADAIPSKIVMAFNLIRDPRSPDLFVKEEMSCAGGNEPKRVKGIKISGLNGWLYAAAEKAPSGRNLNIRHYVARVDAQNLLAIAVLLPDDASEQDLKLVESILSSVKVHP